MSMKKRVGDAVDTAFKACGDLVKDVSLAPETVTGFNNATQTVVSTTPSPVVAKGIPIKRTVTDEGQIEVHFIFKAKEVPLNKYITATMGSETFRITSFDSNGFSVDVIARKES